MNALKTGLTGVQVLLPTDDAALYEAHVRDYKNEFQPVGPEETHLLQSIIDTRWRLARIPGLEISSSRSRPAPAHQSRTRSRR